MRNGEKILGGGGEMEREQTTIRLPAELMEKLKQEAEKLGMSFNALLLMILNEAQSQHQKK